MSSRVPGAAALLVLAACATHQRIEAPPPAPPAPPALDASYDWHVLVAAPFGSVVREVPLKLHEVLLFKARDAPAADAGECYASEEPPPRFLKRTPAQFVLCFAHDHLARIEAVVELPQAEAAQVFTQACALWRQEGAAEPDQPCEGSDAGVRFAARLEAPAADEATVPLSMRLEAASAPEP